MAYASRFVHENCNQVQPKRRFVDCRYGCGAKLIWHSCEVTIAAGKKFWLYEPINSLTPVADTTRPHVCNGPRSKFGSENLPAPASAPAPASVPVAASASASVQSYQPVVPAPVEEPVYEPISVAEPKPEPVDVYGYKPQNGEWDDVMRGARLKHPVLLSGPAGCGKTQLVDALAQAMGRQVFTLQGGQGVLFEHVYGHHDLEGGNTMWKDGVVTAACRANDKAILYLDEPNALDDGIRYLLHGLLDHRKSLTLYEHNNEEVTAPELVIVASINAGREQGASGSVSPLAGAFLSRFERVTLNYLPPDRESKLLVDRTGISAKVANAMVSVANRIRAARTERNAAGLAALARTVPCGTRVLLFWAERVADGDTVRNAARICVEGLGGTPAEEQALREVIDAVLPAEMK